MKETRRIKLKKYRVTGISPDEPVTPQTCSLKGQVYYYRSENDKIRVSNICDGSEQIKLSTQHGVYRLDKHPSQNMYTGECQGVKVHIMLKPMVGEMIFWAEVQNG